ncbi:hypothetical protein PTSG_12013 [Salpingoeca rosetta]|uniref:Uncharacterized protein n=1 Tax=Salpingoeca rosetta (strain ATCC 50818 / BSB-021) TaxID=946362 RepID=F2U510_SALR5|nr:uncharacterized protein PTSG_12013 [Salpingoeca rosetta]EGD82726.1 hypothetical protein PTSG_12013 [Salpingoeca rosetta]|eukprot:XP_004995962.1 hypothetical protein PTSG_12013 [Salpingoeca rosetta]
MKKKVSCRVLSADGEADPTVLAINAAAAALQRAGVPWDGPVAGVRIARTQRGALVTNPDLKTLEGADWNMVRLVAERW